MTIRPLVRQAQEYWTSLNERALNVHTRPIVRSEGLPPPPDDVANFGDGRGYGTVDYLWIWRTLYALAPTRDDTVYDLGCGMGRFLCTAARWQCRRCVGVELSPGLCRIAEANAARVSHRRSPIEIVQGDCSTVDLSDGTVFYLFNPFGAATLATVLSHIRASTVAGHRTVRFAYHNAVHDHVFVSSGWLEPYRSFRTARGTRVSFWRGSAS